MSVYYKYSQVDSEKIHIFDEFEESIDDDDDKMRHDDNDKMRHDDNDKIRHDAIRAIDFLSSEEDSSEESES